MKSHPASASASASRVSLTWRACALAATFVMATGCTTVPAPKPVTLPATSPAPQPSLLPVPSPAPQPSILPVPSPAPQPSTRPAAVPGPIARDAVPSALNNPSRRPCTPEWFSYLETHYAAVGDAQGHGPDPGSDEWLDAFERRRNLPSTSALPREQRCATLARELDYRH